MVANHHPSMVDGWLVDPSYTSFLRYVEISRGCRSPFTYPFCCNSPKGKWYNWYNWYIPPRSRLKLNPSRNQIPVFFETGTTFLWRYYFFETLGGEVAGGGRPSPAPVMYRLYGTGLRCTTTPEHLACGSKLWPIDG